MTELPCSTDDTSRVCARFKLALDFLNFEHVVSLGRDFSLFAESGRFLRICDLAAVVSRFFSHFLSVFPSLDSDLDLAEDELL
jgi:hypothetical protein